MVETVDAVVVGAGHNGLVAANLLADAGWDVLVVEAAEQPGGAVRSAEITAPGYLSDLCSAFYPLGAASPVLAGLDLPGHGLRWTHAPDVVAHVLPDGRAAVLNLDPERTAASLEHFAAGDGQRWLDMYHAWRGVGDQLLATVLRPFPPVRAAARLLASRAPADLLRLARRAVVPVRSLCEQAFDGEGARMLLAGFALHTDLGPDNAGSGMFGWLMAMLSQQYGLPVPVGGAQQITDALLNRLSDRTVQVRCATPVDRVLVAGGRAMGVRTEAGQDIRARRAVLCDVPATDLYGRLVPAVALPARLLEDVRGFDWDDGVVKVDWALSAPVPWTNDAVRGAGTVHLDADMAGLARYHYDISTGRRPRRPFLLAGQMTTADASRSPAGTETLWAYTHVPQRDDWNAEEIDDHVQRIEDVVARHAPGFGDLVVGRHVYGPQALQDENRSLHNGAIGGGTSAAHQQLFLRPVPGLGRADTPIDRLYLAGASAHPGGGVHGAPGANAARAALARNRTGTGDLYGLAVRTAMRVLYRPSP